MGFTPWPYDVSFTAVNTTYDLIQENGDIVAHHLTQGVPWNEALNQTAYPNNLIAEVDGRIAQTLNDKLIFLAIDSLNVLRFELVGNWGDFGYEERTSPWDTRSFDHPDVITAFTNFSLDMIERFDPAYFSYATEVSDLMLSNPQGYNEFVVFAQAVYSNIKARHPNLPVMVSLSLKSPDSGSTDIITNQFSRISDYVDIVGISVYPYAFFDQQDGATPEALPDNWLNQIRTIAPNKPVAITETGWIGEDLKIDSFDLDVKSDEATQNNYVELLLTNADSLDAEFVIWWTMVDYDAMWNGVLGRNDLTAIWKDIGLYDENLQPRQALDTWQWALDKPRSAD